MEQNLNEFNQPIGLPLPDWQPPTPPAREPMLGRFCRLEPVDPPTHAAELFEAFSLDSNGLNWTYLPYGPFPNFEAFREWLISIAMPDDPLFFAIVDDESGKALGVASFSRINPLGSIEVAHIHFSPLLQGKPGATEAMYLMMKLAFELGYRRYEWKCDALNAPSRAAAQRLGFSFEGIFRQMVVYKGRNRDTAWFAMTDRDWPAIREALESWLDPANFDRDGRQKTRLFHLTLPLLHEPLSPATS